MSLDSVLLRHSSTYNFITPKITLTLIRTFITRFYNGTAILHSTIRLQIKEYWARKEK